MTREEAIKLIDTHTVCFYNEIDSPTLQALHLAIEALSADTVSFETQVESTRQVLDDFAKDRVKVVRCKDCRWYDNRYGDVCHNPRYGDGYANYQPPYVDEDYWCKDGERKGGEDE